MTFPFVTIGISVVLAAVWIVIMFVRRVDPQAVCFHHGLAFGQKQYYRILFGHLSHVNPIHIIFNLYSLVQIGSALEGLLGPLSFFFLNGLCLICSTAVYASIVVFVRWLRPALGERLQNTYSLGYSAVVFGLMTVHVSVLHSLSPDARYAFFGTARIHPYIVPFFALILTQIMVSNASFLGHLSGILAGYVLILPMFAPLLCLPDKGIWGDGVVECQALPSILQFVTFAALLFSCYISYRRTHGPEGSEQVGLGGIIAGSSTCDCLELQFHSVPGELSEQGRAVGIEFLPPDETTGTVFEA